MTGRRTVAPPAGTTVRRPSGPVSLSVVPGPWPSSWDASPVTHRAHGGFDEGVGRADESTPGGQRQLLQRLLPLPGGSSPPLERMPAIHVTCLGEFGRGTSMRPRSTTSPTTAPTVTQGSGVSARPARAGNPPINRSRPRAPIALDCNGFRADRTWSQGESSSADQGRGRASTCSCGTVTAPPPGRLILVFLPLLAPNTGGGGPASCYMGAFQAEQGRRGRTTRCTSRTR